MTFEMSDAETGEDLDLGRVKGWYENDDIECLVGSRQEVMKW